MLTAYHPHPHFSVDQRISIGGLTSRIPVLPDIQSSVSAAELKAHLLILSVFNNVHHTVHKGGVVVDDNSGLPVTMPAQFLFLARSQERFDLWVSRVLNRPERNSGPLQESEIPPVDVLMFLHAFMLNPWNYYEDCYRVYPILSAIGHFPLLQIERLINTKTMEITPTIEQITLWESCTGTQFTVPGPDPVAEAIDVTCPCCFNQLNVSWVSDTGNGFGQQGFSTICTQCSTIVTREALTVGRFLKDLAGNNSVLAHTLLTKTGHIDADSAREFTRFIFHSLELQNPFDGARFNWRMSSVLAALRPKMLTKEQHDRLLHVMNAYTHPGQTSMDLGQAVLRQSRFVQEMHRIRWSGNISFEGEETALPKAIIRYHQFLALDPHSIVPSLDIDLAFHTNQLKGAAFREMSFKLLGRLLKHDDSPEKQVIAEHMNYTKNVWKERYGTTYVPGIDSDIDNNNTAPCANGCSG